MGQKSNVKDAIVDLVKAVKPVFKKYTRHTREEAWKDLTNKKGEQEMKKILVNPDRPINTFQKLTFKEWLYS